MKSTLAYILGMVWLLTGCMAQQEVTVLDGRVAALERQSTRAAGQNARLDAHDQEVRAIRRQTAGTAAELERLREELEQLRGSLEVTEHQVAKKLSAGEDLEAKRKMELERLEAQLVAANQKIDRILQYLNIEGTGETGAPQPEQAPAAVSLSDKELYEQAKKAYDGGKLEDARHGFESLLKQHPKSGHADNAQFWIGETYYREKWFEKAILEYQKVIEKYPKGNKVPASRLKQGLAFSNLGDKTNARLILQELIKRHPQSNEAKIAAKKLQKLK